jgi:hypothetical protein
MSSVLLGRGETKMNRVLELLLAALILYPITGARLEDKLYVIEAKSNYNEFIGKERWRRR